MAEPGKRPGLRSADLQPASSGEPETDTFFFTKGELRLRRAYGFWFGVSVVNLVAGLLAVRAWITLPDC